MYKFTHIISYAKKLKLKNINVTVSPIQYDEDKQPFVSVTLEKEYETETFIFTKTKNGIFIEWFINGALYDYNNEKTQLNALDWAYMGY